MTRMLIGLIILTCLICAGCVSVRSGYVEDDKNATAKAIEQFHSRFNTGQLEQIYLDADRTFQSSHSREVLVRTMQDTQNRFGHFNKVTSSQLNVIMDAPVQIRAVYNSRFEKGNATELFLFLRQLNGIEHEFRRAIRLLQ